MKLHGSTSFLGRVRFINIGTFCTAVVETEHDGTQTVGVFDLQLALDLANKRGRQIEIEANVAWELDDRSMAVDVITGIGPYLCEDADPVGALEKLWELTGGWWDGVDVDEFMREMRAD